MTSREDILEIIRTNPGITAKEIKCMVECNDNGVRTKIKGLMTYNMVRKGPKKKVDIVIYTGSFKSVRVHNENTYFIVED